MVRLALAGYRRHLRHDLFGQSSDHSIFVFQAHCIRPHEYPHFIKHNTLGPQQVPWRAPTVHVLGKGQQQ
mgnify:CR=1 FL=1